MRVDWLVVESSRQQKNFAQILQLVMWIRTIWVAVAHRPASPFTHAISRTDTSKVKKSIRSCCTVFQRKVFQKELQVGNISLTCSRTGCERCRTRIVAPIENTFKQFKFSLNQNLPTLFTLRDDESRIIAGRSSNVDDLWYGYLHGGAEVMTSVLQQILGW